MCCQGLALKQLKSLGISGWFSLIRYPVRHVGKEQGADLPGLRHPSSRDTLAEFRGAGVVQGAVRGVARGPGSACGQWKGAPDIKHFVSARDLK